MGFHLLVSTVVLPWPRNSGHHHLFRKHGTYLTTGLLKKFWITLDSNLELWSNFADHVTANWQSPCLPQKEFTHWFCMNVTTRLDLNRGPGTLCPSCGYTYGCKSIALICGYSNPSAVRHTVVSCMLCKLLKKKNVNYNG